MDRRTNRLQRTPRLRLGFNPGVTGAGSLILDVRCKPHRNMGADAFYVYYGVKRSVEPNSSEMDLLEQEKHPIIDAASDAKLHVTWGRMTEGADYFLLIGHQIGCFGVENETYQQFSTDEIRRIMEQTDQRLRQAGISETPAFHCQLNAQY